MNNLWPQIKEHLKDRMPLNNYRKFVEDIQAVKIDAGTLTIGASSQYNKDWIDSHLSAIINNYLGGVVGVDRVEFVVLETVRQ